MFSFETVRQHRASAILLQPLDGEILTRAPDHTSLVINTSAARSHQQHMGASYRGELTNIGEVLAAVSGLIEEYRHLASRGHLVDDVVDDAAGQQVALGAVPARHPDRSIDEPESRGNSPQLRIGRDKGVQCRI